jgi:hypothetical protein
MYIVSKSSNATWKRVWIRVNSTIGISTPCPAIIQIDCAKMIERNGMNCKSAMHNEQTIVITSFSETARYNRIDCLFDQFFIDITMKTIPTIPACNKIKRLVET